MGFFSKLFSKALMPTIMNLEKKLSDRDRFNFEENDFRRTIDQIFNMLRNPETGNQSREALRRLERLTNHRALSFDERKMLEKQIRDYYENYR